MRCAMIPRRLAVALSIVILAGSALFAAPPEPKLQGLSKAYTLARELRSRLSRAGGTTPVAATKNARNAPDTTMKDAHVASVLAKIEDALAAQGRALGAKRRGFWPWGGDDEEEPVQLGWRYRKGNEVGREHVGIRWQSWWQTLYPVAELTKDVLLRKDKLPLFEELVTKGYIKDLAVGSEETIEIKGKPVKVVHVGFFPIKKFFVGVDTEKSFDKVTFNHFKARTVHHARCWDWEACGTKTEELGRDTELRIINAVVYKNPAWPHSTPMPFAWIQCSDDGYEPQ